MKKNTLYTVNPWNRNLFYNGGLSSAVNSAINWKPGNTYTVQPKNYVSGIDFSTNYGNTGQRFNAIVNSGNNGLGNWKNAGINTNGVNGGGNQDSKGLSSEAQAAIGLGAEALGSIPTGDKRGMWDTLDPVYHLADGRESKVGNAFSDTGVMLTKTGLSTGNYYLALAGAAAKIVGGLANAGWGYKIENEGAVKDNINNLKNVRFGGDFDDIQSQAARTSINGMGLGKVSDGWFNSKGTRKAKELIAQQENALAFANNSLDNAIYNAQQDQTNGLLRNYAALGGYIGIPTGMQTGALGIMQQDKYIDAINNRSNAIAKAGTILPASSYATLTTNKFDAGGFVDNFMQDPVAAAMNYIKQRDDEEAQAEALAAQEAREQAFADMQTRLLNAETQNQGLQALLEDQNRSIAALQEAQNAALLTPSTAVTEPVGDNNTWDYIEEQLRRSGKFNDVQIEGIKYNLQRESALDYTNKTGDNGRSWGLAQWEAKRRPKDMSLAGQTQHLIDTLSTFDGKDHWIGRSNYEGFMNARTPEEAHYWIAKGYERPKDTILAKVKRDSDMSLRNLRAFGGELGTNGADFTNGLLQVNAGNTHERNPFGGVPMGLDPQGIPNLVEEGETVFNDYVFSKRLKVPNFMLKDLGLGGAIHKGKRHRMSFAEVSKKLAEESEMRPNDPISMNGLQASLSKLMEIQEAERMKERAKLQNRKMEGLEFACGGKMGKKYAGGGDKSSNHDYGKNANSKKPTSNKPFEWTFNPDIGLYSTPEGEMARLAKAAEDARKAEENASLRAVAAAEAGMGRFPGANRNNGNTGNNDDYDPYPTWMRYAPAVGAGIFTLTDTLGLTNKPDYTYASKLEAAANRAGYAPNIQAPVIGDYMRYTPLDRLFYANQLQANARATDRALMNTSGGNSGTARAAMIANGYNANNNLGNLYRQAEEYNRGMYERTKDFNRRTNMFNAQMGLEADIANARYRQQAAQMGLSGLAQAAAMREAIDSRIGAARSANLTNFLTSLGNIGRENFALNQINSDRSNRYGARANGTSYYKGTGRAKGGKIQKRKK